MSIGEKSPFLCYTPLTEMWNTKTNTRRRNRREEEIGGSNKDLSDSDRQLGEESLLLLAD